MMFCHYPYKLYSITEHYGDTYLDGHCRLIKIDAVPYSQNLGLPYLSASTLRGIKRKITREINSRYLASAAALQHGKGDYSENPNAPSDNTISASP